MIMTRTLFAVLLSVAIPTIAMAQDATDPVASLNAPEPEAPKGIVQATATAPSTTSTAPAKVETSKRPPRVHSTTPPPEITVENGRNTVFSVALFHANRIITPFRNPEIRTSSTSLLTVESGIVYVTTQSEDPIGLFVFDKSDPTQAISLTLNPAPISPVSVKINLEGWTPPATSTQVQSNPEKARTFETEDPYVTTLKDLFKELASQRVPDGYGLSTVNGRYPYMPDCQIPGAHVVPVQVLDGAEVTAIVARITNTSYQVIDVDGSACHSDRLLGVSSWPVTELGPGESAEMYLAIKAPASDDQHADRPSVVRTRIQ